MSKSTVANETTGCNSLREVTNTYLYVSNFVNSTSALDYDSTLRLIVMATAWRCFGEQTRAQMSFADIEKRTGCTRWTIGRALARLPTVKLPILKVQRNGSHDVYEFDVVRYPTAVPATQRPDRTQAEDDAEWLMRAWNAGATTCGLRPAGELAADRRHRIRKLFRAHPLRAYWQGVVDRLMQSGFCTGRTPGRDGKLFRADFDFLLKIETHVKVLEGKYDDAEFADAGLRRDGRVRVYSDEPVLDMRRFSGGH